jgi:protein-tyrosine-phosphatase
MATILIVGAADTGRAPMACALLQRQFQARHSTHQVASAGILGHDGDPATDEALKAMEQINIDIGGHIARSLDDTVAAGADLLIAIDNGTARVVRARFAERAAAIHTLGELSGQNRDIPDPFKMQIGAWLGYARELDDLLGRALPRIFALLGEPQSPDEPANVVPERVPEVVSQPVALPQALQLDRAPAVQRMLQLLSVVEQMPGVVDWPAARARILAELDLCMAPAAAGDAGPALAGMLRAALSLSATTPSPHQIAALQDAVGLLLDVVPAQAISAFSAVLGAWNE